MKNELLQKVKEESLDKLIDAIGEVINEMKERQPNKNKRFEDSVYCTILNLNVELIRTLREKVLENIEDKVEG